MEEQNKALLELFFQQQQKELGGDKFCK